MKRERIREESLSIVDAYLRGLQSRLCAMKQPKAVRCTEEEIASWQAVRELILREPDTSDDSEPQSKARGGVRDQKWLDADWSLSDAELGALYDVSRQRAHEMRKLLGAPKAHLYERKRQEKMTRLLEQLRALPFNPALASADALAMRLSVATPMLIEAEHSIGIKRHRAGALNASQTVLNPIAVDWRLSNDSLRVIWQTSMNAIANERHRFKRGPAYWDGRRKLSDEDRWNLDVATRAQERVVQRFHEERQAIAEFLRGKP